MSFEMENKLKSMVNYVLEFPATHDYEYALIKHLDYANFLSQKPEIGMFVACDEDGNVLEEPNEIGGIIQYPEEQKYYQQAKEACIFEGFEVKRFSRSKDNHFDCICSIDNHFTLWIKDVGSTKWKSFINSDSTIEDLVKYNTTLTDKQAKRLGL